MPAAPDLTRDFDLGVVTGVVTFSVDGVLRSVFIGCDRALNTSTGGARLGAHSDVPRYSCFWLKP